jgi:tetratricopeptide (TPR) repeat protein
MAPADSSSAARADRLDRYLQQDPGNLSLLGEACDAAISAGRHDRALAYVERAEALAGDASAWTFRKATICIAQRNLEQAQKLLEELAHVAPHPAVSHDLGHVSLLRGDAAAARAAVEDWLAQDDVSPEHLGALQMLWLRASHRLHQEAEALAWAQAEQKRGRLDRRAMGPAALIAIDSSEFELALAWSDAALASDEMQMEALVARSYVAMAQREPERAAALLDRAISANPGDGRIWSARGYASLQRGELAQAQEQLEHAVQLVKEHVGTWHALGWACLLQNNLAGAANAFAQALERDHNFAESHGAVGLVLALSGRAEEAEHHLQVAARLDPANVTGRYARALRSGEAGDRERLARLADRLLDRPGFFGRSLGQEFNAAVRRP